MKKILSHSVAEAHAVTSDSPPQTAGRALGLPTELVTKAAASGLALPLTTLWTSVANSPLLQSQLAAVVSELQHLPQDSAESAVWASCTTTTEFLSELSRFFLNWYSMLPSPNETEGDELLWIRRIDTLLCDVVSARTLLESPTHSETGGKSDPAFKIFLKEFNRARAAFLDSAASTATIADWIRDPHSEIEDFEKTQPEAYKSWNDFFERRLHRGLPNDSSTATGTAPRPVAHPTRDWLVSAPTDCIVQPLMQVQPLGDGTVVTPLVTPLGLETVLDVKGEPVQVAPLLGRLPDDIKMRFSGGTGYSCVLLPNGYHHFHAPVSGRVVHAEVVEADSYGLSSRAGLPGIKGHSDGTGAFGGETLELNQFARFSRAIVVIEVPHSCTEAAGSLPTEPKGWVASIAVGLNTIGSVCIADDITPAARVMRGETRLGNFSYGGSLNILLFSDGLLEPGLQVRLGAQIGKMV